MDDSERRDSELSPLPVDVPVAPVETTPVHPRRPRSGTVLVVAGVVALLLVGALVVSALVGGGGADSPESAVRALADAVSHEDPLAAADVLAPNEVRTLHGTVEAAERRAQELALVEAAGAPLSGLDLSVENLRLSSENLADGYAKVTILGGTFSARTAKAKFSPLMQKALRNSEDSSVSKDLAQLASSDELPTFVMVVRQDGRWYVSAFYTLFEYLREYNHWPAADLGSGSRDVATLGADSPDAAVQNAMRALGAGDWQHLIELAPPDEIPAYDYRAGLAQAGADSGRLFTIDDMTTSSQVDGDTAHVALTVAGHTDSSTWTLRGACLDTTNTEPDNPDHLSVSTCGRQGSMLSFIFDATGNGASATATAVRENGRWFVSGVNTALRVVDNAIGALSRRTLYTMLSVPDQLPPDGVLTLGEPVSVPAGFDAYGYTFQGHSGERLLGLARNPDDTSATRGFRSVVRVFAPDGRELPEAAGVTEGVPLTLPADGTYRIVLQPGYGPFFSGPTVTVTLWDEADAPPAARQSDSGAESCTYSFLSEDCTSTSSSSSGSTSFPTPTITVPAPPPVTIAGG